MLTITISGPPMSGKTSLAEFIGTALLAKGVEVTVSTEEINDMLKYRGLSAGRVVNLNNKQVLIKTQQTNREPNVQT